MWTLSLGDLISSREISGLSVRCQCRQGEVAGEVGARQRRYLVWCRTSSILQYPLRNIYCGTHFVIFIKLIIHKHLNSFPENVTERFSFMQQKPSTSRGYPDARRWKLFSVGMYSEYDGASK